MVWPSRERRRQRKHAFEEALDEARLDPNGEPVTSDAFDGVSPGAQRGVGSFGDLSVAEGYVARSSLQRAYDDDEDIDADDDQSAPSGRGVRPADAALKLIAELGAGAFSIKQLAQLRRMFASENHPDRVAPEQRDEAVRAMAEVNAAIDRALKLAKTT